MSAKRIGILTSGGDCPGLNAVIRDAAKAAVQAGCDYHRLHVLSATFERQDYAIAMPRSSPLREQVNRAVLRVISKPSWDEQLADYLGDR